MLFAVHSMLLLWSRLAGRLLCLKFRVGSADLLSNGLIVILLIGPAAQSWWPSLLSTYSMYSA